MRPRSRKGGLVTALTERKLLEGKPRLITRKGERGNMEDMTRDEFIFFLYAIQELLESENYEGAKRVVAKAIKQSERRETTKDKRN